MKLIKKKFLTFLFVAIMAFFTVTFASCNSSPTNSIAGVEIVDGELIVTYSDGTTDNLGKVVGSQGEKGTVGEKGTNGTDGTTPHIGENGNWFIGTTDTGVKAEGVDGNNGTNGTDGTTPHIGENGNWFIGTTDTGVKAEGVDGNNGTNGTDGTTPHIGENGNWFIGTTDTGVKAEGVDGNNGTNGTDGTTPHIGENGNWFIGTTDTGVKAEGVDGNNGTDGVGVVGISSEYGLDQAGEKCIIFTFTMSDESIQVVYCEIPKEIDHVESYTQTFYALSEGEELPKPRIRVFYKDNSSEEIEVTDSMITYSNVNYLVGGHYNMTGEYQGYDFDIDIHVIDVNDLSILSLNLNHDNVIWDWNSETSTVEENLTGLELTIERANGITENVDVTSEMISYSDVSVDEKLLVHGNFEGKEFDFYVMPKILSDVTMENSSYPGSNNYEIGLNEQPFTGEYIESYSCLEYEYWCYYEEVTTDMLWNADNNEPFSSSVEGETTYKLTSLINPSFESYITIDVIDFSKYSLIDVGFINDTYRVTNDGSMPEILLGLKYEDSDTGNTKSKEGGLLTQDMITNLEEINFAEIGEYDVEFVYEKKNYSQRISVYNPSINNISSVYIENLYDTEIDQGANLSDFLSQWISENNATVNLYFYEWHQGLVSTVPLTIDMFALDDFDTSTIGSQRLVYSYNGVQGSTCLIVVPDMTNANLIDTYSFDEKLQNVMGVSTVDLYDNNICVFNEEYCTYELDITNNTVEVMLMGNTLLYSVDTENKTVSAYNTTETALGTYINEQEKLKVILYNGFAMINYYDAENNIDYNAFTIKDESFGEGTAVIDVLDLMTVTLKADGTCKVVYDN